MRRPRIAGWLLVVLGITGVTGSFLLSIGAVALYGLQGIQEFGPVPAWIVAPPMMGVVLSLAVLALGMRRMWPRG